MGCIKEGANPAARITLAGLECQVLTHKPRGSLFFGSLFFVRSEYFLRLLGSEEAARDAACQDRSGAVESKYYGRQQAYNIIYPTDFTYYYYCCVTTVRQTNSAAGIGGSSTVVLTLEDLVVQPISMCAETCGEVKKSHTVGSLTTPRAHLKSTIIVLFYS